MCSVNLLVCTKKPGSRADAILDTLRVSNLKLSFGNPHDVYNV